jgi:uncharacterized Zn-finger protein
MTTTVIIVISAVVLLAALVLIFVLARKTGPVEESYLHVPCPSCKRKLRFRPRQAGNFVICPQCSKRFDLP